MILGIHSNKKTKITGDSEAKTPESAISRDIEKYKLNASQIFTHNPRSGVKIQMNYSSVAKISENISLLVHGPYTLIKIFNITQEEFKEQLPKLDIQFKIAADIGAKGIVFHIGRIRAETEQEAIQKTIKAIETILPLAENHGVDIIVESIACKAVPGRTFESTEMINKVTAGLSKHKFDRYWSWCIDTAHIWSMGIDVRYKKTFEKWLSAIQFPQKITTFHLNGSAANFNSGKDMHEIPFSSTDKIWHGIKPEESGVAALAKFALRHNCITILEVNRGSDKDLKKTIDIIFGFEKINGGEPNITADKEEIRTENATENATEDNLEDDETTEHSCCSDTLEDD